jgi:hypothetical protein
LTFSFFAFSINATVYGHKKWNKMSYDENDYDFHVDDNTDDKNYNNLTIIAGCI